MEDIDDDDDQLPRVVYVDPEREGRLARYGAAGGGGGGGGVDGDGDGTFFGVGGGRVSQSQSTVRSGGHSAGAAVRAGGAALWASDDESEGVAPSLLNEEEDDDLDAVEYVRPGTHARLCPRPTRLFLFLIIHHSKK